jgi:hypothetical protein
VSGYQNAGALIDASESECEDAVRMLIRRGLDAFSVPRAVASPIFLPTARKLVM